MRLALDRNRVTLPQQNSLEIHDRLKTNGRARLLPSWRRIGSAGASPSRSMNWLEKVDINMFTGVASPSRVMNGIGKVDANMLAWVMRFR